MTCICVLTAFCPSFPHLETLKKILENSTLSRYVKKKKKKKKKKIPTDRPNFLILVGWGQHNNFFFWPYIQARCSLSSRRTNFNMSVRFWTNQLFLSLVEELCSVYTLWCRRFVLCCSSFNFSWNFSKFPIKWFICSFNSTGDLVM